MSKGGMTQEERIRNYARLIEKQTGRSVRPARFDGYVNMLNRYGTSKDPSEHYRFQPEPMIPDEIITNFYEGNGLFSKIIDLPSEECVKHGFELKGVTDQKILDFMGEALDELDWEETAMKAIKWARLFGGSIAVMLIDDGRGLDEPLDWRRIKSIDDIRVYERTVIQPDISSMTSYRPNDPFHTRGSRLGMPERYFVSSKYGNFTVHDSRCLVFQNGILPENTMSSIYELWGIPEYVRIRRAIQDSELAHRSAPKLLDRSVQAIYKMKDLAAELATEEGESRVLKRLEAIDLARGMMNSMVIDAEGEDYDFKSFAFSGINDAVSASCNMLSAITNIPQSILFGSGTNGLSSTDDTSMENYYNYVQRCQKKFLRSNLRYLLSVLFQAGLRNREIDEIPKINVEFNPLWSLSENEKADLDHKKAQTQLTKAQTAQAYVDMQAIDAQEVRKKLADSEEFDVENMLDEVDEEDLFSGLEEESAGQSNGKSAEVPTDAVGHIAQQGDFKQYAQNVNLNEHRGEVGENAPAAAPAATKLEQDKTAEEKAKEAAQSPVQEDSDNLDKLPTESDTPLSVGVIVISEGKVLSGRRHNDTGYGLICGPGGHVEEGETAEEAAIRETQEEFSITPTELIPLGNGPTEPKTGLTPEIFLCTEFEGTPDCQDLEMIDPKFRSIEELNDMDAILFQPFKDSLLLLADTIAKDNDADKGKPISEEIIPENIEKPLDFKTVKDIVTLRDFIMNFERPDNSDGAPMGNQNAAGPHKDRLSHGPNAKALTGATTHGGKKISGLWDHADRRMKEKDIHVESVKRALTAEPRAGNVPGRSVYEKNGTRVVVEDKTMEIVTVVYKGKKGKK